MRKALFLPALIALVALALACSPQATPTPAPTATPTPRPTTLSTPTATPTPRPTADATPTSTGATSVPKRWSSPPPMTIDTNKNYVAVLDTSQGAIKVQMLVKEAPKTVNNFVFLAREGFYNGTRFHRVIKGFMIQGGDPLGTGTGGPGYKFADELPTTRGYTTGIMAMANSGPNTNGSQFFIMDADYPLQKNYSIFGQVVEGQDIVHKIASVPVGPGNPGENSRPVTDVKLNSVTIEESGP